MPTFPRNIFELGQMFGDDQSCQEWRLFHYSSLFLLALCALFTSMAFIHQTLPWFLLAGVTGVFTVLFLVPCILYLRFRRKYGGIAFIENGRLNIWVCDKKAILTLTVICPDNKKEQITNISIRFDDSLLRDLFFNDYRVSATEHTRATTRIMLTSDLSIDDVEKIISRRSQSIYAVLQSLSLVGRQKVLCSKTHQQVYVSITD